MRKLQILNILVGSTLTLSPLTTGCRGTEPVGPALTQDMRDAYAATRQLYSYVWSDEKFYSSHSEKQISQLLLNLAKDFHRAEIDTPIERFEPGFRVALLTQQNLLKDAALRFGEGKKEYANWRLRGMATNCIACHSRYSAPVNFLGELPQVDEEDQQSQFSQAEFLFATRQFDLASDKLYKMADELSRTGRDWHHQLRALKLWLVIEVRTKNRPGKSADLLERYSLNADLPNQYKSTLDQWVFDLREASSQKGISTDPVTEAEQIIHHLEIEPSLKLDERHLVVTLKATSHLHTYLERETELDKRRKATLLLSLAYNHIPLSLFSSFTQQYLEIVIRDYPHSKESLEAFKAYEANLLGDLGADGGGKLAPDQVNELKELRKLAYPEASPEESTQPAFG